MARFVGNTTGNWSTAGTWNQVANTPTLHASTNITISTTPLFTATWTAPNTTNKVTGVGFYLNTANTSGGNITVTLQESTVDTAATVTVSCALFPHPLTWIYFKFATPYQYTTTGAGAYRFKIVNSSSSNTPSFAANSGGSNCAYLATHDITGPPATTDDVFILGNNGANTITVTVDGTQTVGSNATDGTTTSRLLTKGVALGERGKLNWDTSASATLNCNGCFYTYAGSIHEMGTVASPYPSGRVAKLVLGQYSSASRHIYVANGSVVWQGTPKSSTSLWKTTRASGTGTAASPLVTATAVDWSVDDEMAIAGTSDGGYQTEYRYIKTKNSSTSYVLSSTIGGAEAALTYTHSTSAYIINLTRNVVLTTDSASYGTQWWMGYTMATTTDDTLDVDWVRYENLNSFGVLVGGAQGGVYSYLTLDYSVVYSTTSTSGWFWNGSNSAATYTGLVGSRAAMFFQGSSSFSFSKTLVDCLAIGGNAYGVNALQMTGGANTYTRFLALDCFRGVLATNNGSLFDTCEFQSSGAQGIWLAGGAELRFRNCLVGTKGKSGAQDVLTQISYNDAIFDNCTFGNTTYFVGQTDMTVGSKIGFATPNATANTHFYYQRQGTISSTGTGLSDTTVHTAGGFGVRFEPIVALNPLTWIQNVPTGNIQNRTMNIAVWCKINSATYYGGSVYQYPRLTVTYDNGTVAYSQASATTAWQLLFVSFTPTTTYGQITVQLSARTDATGSNSYVYWDDMAIQYPAGYTLDLGSLDVFADGLPVTPSIATNLSALSVWTAASTVDYGANTMGEKVAKKLLTTNKFIGLG